MNGRIYDPLIGRFLSADPYVQDEMNLQSYNRYSYVWNNPLRFTDPTGEFVWFAPMAIGAAIGGGIGAIVGGVTAAIVSKGDMKATLAGAAGGAVAGAITGSGAGLLGAALGASAIGGGTVVAGSVGVGALGGMAGSATDQVTQQTLNGASFSDAVQRIDGEKVVVGGAVGGVLGLVGGAGTVGQQLVKEAVKEGQEKTAAHLTQVVAPALRSEVAHGVEEEVINKVVDKVVSEGSKNLASTVGSVQTAATLTAGAQAVAVPVVESTTNTVVNDELERRK